MADDRDHLDEIFEDDPFRLLDLKPTRAPAMTEIDRLRESFEEVCAFYDEHRREPEDSATEFHLSARLDGIRQDPHKIELLNEHDRHGLLDGYGAAPPDSIDELLESDSYGLLEDEALEIFDLRNVRKPMEMPDYVARRRRCRDFERFRPLFEQCQADLDCGERFTMSFSREQGMEVGDFYILRGLLTYIADKRDPVMKDGEPNYRLRCIFSNGTEADLLMLSLARNLYRHGRRISREGEALLGLEDATGYVYVLRSLSKEPAIASRPELYKVGFSQGPVEKRIKNAERDPTYLMAPVQIVETFEVNINVSKLEHLLHVFFADAQFEIEVVTEDGTLHTPNEWFDVPLDVIDEAVHAMVSGDITDYRYDPAQRRVVDSRRGA